MYTRAKESISKKALLAKADLLHVARCFLEAANAPDPDGGKGPKEILTPFATHCTAWDSKMKTLSAPVKTVLDTLVPTIAGWADLLSK